MRLVLAALIALALAGCGSKYRWENPDLPREQWSQDRAWCKAQARKRAEEEFVDDGYHGADADLGRATTLETQMRRHRASKSGGDHYARCLARMGYRKVKVEEKKAD